jgi:hypothetical protein
MVVPKTGCIYVMPYHHTHVLKLSSKSFHKRNFSVADGPQLLDTPGTIAGGINFGSAVIGADLCIYGIPLNGMVVLRIDPRTDSVGTIDLGTLDRFSGSYKWQGGALAEDGCIYCAPHLVRMGADSSLLL